MPEWISILWSLIDATPDGITAQALEEWMPPDVMAVLWPAWLRETTAAQIIVCPECGDHDEEVMAVSYPSGEYRCFIPCDVHGRVEIMTEELRQWRFDLDAVGASVASSLSLAGNPSAVISQRLWKLGRTQWQQKLRDVWFVRQLATLESSTWKTMMRCSLRPILLTSGDVPEEPLWESRPPAIVSLSQVSQWCDSQFTIDHRALMECVVTQDELVAATEPAEPLQPSARAIRRQVKAEIKSMLSDEACVAAFREHGSYRKAADFMSMQTGQKISKDRISRAVNAAGGVGVVAAQHNSHSVRRTVASQRCDSKKIISNSSEVIDWQ